MGAKMMPRAMLLAVVGLLGLAACSSSSGAKPGDGAEATAAAGGPGAAGPANFTLKGKATR